jgi:hypothetical protein
MSYTVTSIDYDALPDEMLPFAKQHMRVTFTDDDATISRYLRWAIGQAEQVLGISLNPATVTWTPDLADLSAYPFPLQPVASFSVTADSIDMTADFIKNDTGLVTPPLLIHVDGTPFPDDTTVAFVAGVTTSDEMTPNIEASIYRIAATLYENRESITTLTLETMPLWLNDMLVGTWVPRA